MKTVCVIGAGPAGLVVTKELKQTGVIEVTTFDRQGSVGGRWARDADCTGVWKELCLNLTRRSMEFSDFPWDETNVKPNHNKEYAGMFPHHEECTDYIEAYAAHFDLLSHIKLKTDVVSVKQDGDGWKVVTKPLGGGEETAHTFDGLVVCVGLYGEPFNPLRDKELKNFTGQVQHSQQFKSTKDYKGQRVLVVGSVVSGPEISASLATEGECQKVVSSVRHVPYNMTKVSPKTDQPFEDIIFVRFPVWLGRVLSESMMVPGLKSTVLDNFPDQLTKGDNCYANPDEDIRLAGICTSVNFVKKVNDGSLKVMPGIKSAEGKTITFTDDSKEDFDTVICGTGYNPMLSFLPENLKDKLLYTAAGGKTEVELYHDCLVPDCDNLAFCGVMTIIGTIDAPSELQARLIAGTFSGKVKRNPVGKMKATAQAERLTRESSFFGQKKSALVLQEEIGDDLGITPSFTTAFWEPTKYLFSPVYSCCYRMNPAVDGEETAKKARERFENYLANPQKAKW